MKISYLKLTEIHLTDRKTLLPLVKLRPRKGDETRNTVPLETQAENCSVV